MRIFLKKLQGFGFNNEMEGKGMAMTCIGGTKECDRCMKCMQKEAEIDDEMYAERSGDRR